MIGAMTTSPFADLRPNVGDPAPEFTLQAVWPEGEPRPVTLAEVIASAPKGAIVYFYPEAATPGCTVEACDFRDSLDRLAAAGYAVVGVSPDPLEKLEAFRDDEGLTFPLASDPDVAIATAFNTYGPHNVMGHIKTSVIRSTFVVAPDGTLTYVKRNARAKGHVARLAKDLGLD